MKNFFYQTKNSLLITLSCIILGYLCLVAVESIPNKYIEKNIINSAQKLEKDCDLYDRTYIYNKDYSYDSGYLFIDGVFLDIFTEADALAITYNNKTNNPFYSAVYCYNYYIKNIGKNNRGIKALQRTVYNKIKKTGIYEHSQEWHGYRVWLKPALIFFDISDIRLILFLFTQFLFIFVCIGISKSFKNIYGFVTFFISFEYFNYSLGTMSFIFGMDICTMLAGCLGVIYVYKKNLQIKYLSYIFTLVGISAAYFSMFTLPLITIGFPLILWLSLPKYDFEENKRIYFLLKYCFYWLIGYFGMGLAKIVLSIILFNAQNGIFCIKWYTGLIGKLSLYDRFENIIYYISNINNYSYFRLLIIIFIVVVIMAVIVIKFKKFIRQKNKLQKYLPYLIIFSFPILWVFVVPVHIKEWTIFLFSISIYAVLEMISEIKKL